MTSDEPAIRLAGLAKRFGRVPAVTGLDLTVPAGQTVALTPAFRYTELGWAVVRGDAPVPAGVVILSAWTLPFGVLAAWAYAVRARTR